MQNPSTGGLSMWDKLDTKKPLARQDEGTYHVKGTDIVFVLRYCTVCDEPQLSTPAAVAAWDDEIAINCLCQSCYWRLKD